MTCSLLQLREVLSCTSAFSSFLIEFLVMGDSHTACWSEGQRAPYLHLARTFDLLESEKGKIKATSMLCNMFRRFLAAVLSILSLITVRLYYMCWLCCLWSYLFTSYFSLASLLALSPEDVLPAVYLCTNKIAADHENMVCQIPFLISLHNTCCSY